MLIPALCELRADIQATNNFVKELRAELEAIATAAKQTRDWVDSIQAAAREDRRTVTDLRNQLAVTAFRLSMKAASCCQLPIFLSEPLLDAFQEEEDSGSS